jgi:hypothetical protein
MGCIFCFVPGAVPCDGFYSLILLDWLHMNWLLFLTCTVMVVLPCLLNLVLCRSLKFNGYKNKIRKLYQQDYNQGILSHISELN